jgi:CubicO group peptidase (beta-lactamase class C family)
VAARGGATYESCMFKLGLVLVAACGSMPPAVVPDAGPVDLAQELAPIASQQGMPALAALAADDVAILGQGVTGVRKLGDPTPATPHDRWHLGSDTKAMTATLVAGAVEAGTLGWDTTIAQAFPGMTIDPGYRDVTIAQLLSHVGGAPATSRPTS